MPIPTATGLLLLVHHVLALLAAASVLGTLIASGMFVLRRVLKSQQPAIIALPVAAGMGIGVVGALLLGVAAFAARGIVLWGLLALLSLLAWAEWKAAPRLIAAAWRDVLNPWPAGFPRTGVAAVLVVIALSCLLIALGPPVEYDSLAYHLRVPAQWLQHGRIFIPSDNYHTAFIGAAQCLYLPLLALRMTSAVQILNVGLMLLAALGVYALGTAARSARVGATAMLILFASPIVLLVGTQPMTDVTLLLPLVSATLLLVSAPVERTHQGELYLAAALLGIGFGVKYTGFIYAIALAAVFVIAGARGPHSGWRVSRRQLCLLVVIAVLTAGPWIAKNAVMFGNPVFPMQSRVRVEPWLQPLYPGLRSQVPDSALTAIHRAMRRPMTVERLFLEPASLEPDVDAPQSAPYLPLLLAPLALFLPPRRRMWLVVLPSLVYLLLLLSYSRYSSIRYLLPALPGFAVGLAVVVHDAARRMRRVARSVLVTILVILALPTPVALVNRLRTRSVLQHTLGLMSANDVMRRYRDTAEYADLAGWTNAHVAKDARIVLLFEARGFYLRAPGFEDLLLRNWIYLAPKWRQDGCLRSLRLDYLVLNDDARHYFTTRGVSPQAFSWGEFREFQEKCLVERYRNSKFVVYAWRR